MTWLNQTMVSEFILLGFSDLGELQVLLFMVFLLIYMLTVTGNFLIILLTKMDAALHSPMYFFLRNLSFADLGFVSCIIPKMLVNLLSKEKTISLSGCRTQMYFAFFFGATECFILIVMAYDRFVAICHPLRYTVIMNSRLCAWLLIVVWSAGLPLAIINSTWLFTFPFCKSNVVSHFYCDFPPVFQLACGNTSTFELFSIVGTFIVILFPFSLILISYVHIISTIFRMPTTEGRRKAFSTCSSHITAVTLFYGTAGLNYVQPRSSYSPESKYLLSVSYIVITPMLNPIIYSLRNREVKGALWRFFGRKKY
ncbi:olfactory receptor 10A4-like [Tiliqua scincoides]|uniref:olfactory receptor 10A4-like n=1 Tax=Tiliqua scincoides TaxID=71010 RepID=UPI00346212CF